MSSGQLGKCVYFFFKKIHPGQLGIVLFKYMRLPVGWLVVLGLTAL